MWDTVLNFLEKLILPPTVFYVIGVVTTLWLLLVLIGRIRRANRPIIPFRAEGGDVEIAPQTIRGIINGASTRVMGVESANCRYLQKGRKLRVQVTIHLRASAKLTEVSVEIKKRIRHALKSHIGMEPTDVDPIKIRVVKIIGEPATLEEEEPPALPRNDLDTIERFDEIEDEVPEGQSPYRQ